MDNESQSFVDAGTINIKKEDDYRNNWLKAKSRLKVLSIVKRPIEPSPVKVCEIYEEAKPMSDADKTKKRIQNIICCRKFSRNANNNKEDGNLVKGYYRVSSELGVRRSGYITSFLNWSFKSSFNVYILSAFLIYMGIILFFSAMIVACAYFVSGVFELCDQTEFTDLSTAFALSWTTFSTVGYGHVSPNMSRECGNLMNTVASLEALVGVLFAEFVGAIFYAKVSSVYSRATIICSSVCIIRYGDGIDEVGDDEFEMPSELEILLNRMSTLSSSAPDGVEVSMVSSESSPEIAPTQTAPFPVLVFRIVNERANKSYGDITNLVLNAVGIIEQRHNQDAPNNDKIVARRQYRQLVIQPSTLPSFKRIVYIRHVLDKDSPLLSPETQSMIKRNNGKWPATINTAEKIRECLEFAQMHISFQGISNVSGSLVYYQKPYTMEEIKIGWRFVDMTYKDEGDSGSEYKVDFDFVNVVMEQAGGGGEALEQDIND